MEQGRRRAHGQLEAHVLQALWAAAQPMTAREILEAIPGRTPAHTTVLTALERLRDKGDVERISADARGIRFAATRTEAEHTGLAMLQRLSHATDREAALMRFAGSLDAKDVAFLRQAISTDNTDPQ